VITRAVIPVAARLARNGTKSSPETAHQIDRIRTIPRDPIRICREPHSTLPRGALDICSEFLRVPEAKVDPTTAEVHRPRNKSRDPRDPQTGWRLAGFDLTWNPKLIRSTIVSFLNCCNGNAELVTNGAYKRVSLYKAGVYKPSTL
jgi:hypothetical protein